MDINNKSSDHECRCGGNVIEASGELVCGACATVIGYVAEPPHNPPADTNLDFGLATTVGSKDYTGTRLCAAARLRCAHRRTQTHHRSLPLAMAKINKLRTDLHLTTACAEYAAYLYRMASASGLLAGRSACNCVAATVLLACRRHGIARTIADVVNTTHIKRRDVYRAYRVLHDALDVYTPLPGPVAHLTRVANAVGVTEATRREAIDILVSAPHSEMTGKDPICLAASALYLACVMRGEVVYRRDIAKAAGVAESTLSARYRSLLGRQPDWTSDQPDQPARPDEPG